MSDQKVKFYELFEDLYDKVLNAIQLDSRTKCDDGAKFKYWCKNQFKVETIGARNLLYCSKTSLPQLRLRKRPSTPFCAAI